MSRTQNEMHTVEVIFCNETAQAVGFFKTDSDYKADRATWMSKNVASLEGVTSRGKVCRLEAPEWLLEKEGMI